MPRSYYLERKNSAVLGEESKGPHASAHETDHFGQLAEGKALAFSCAAVLTAPFYSNYPVGEVSVSSILLTPVVKVAHPVRGGETTGWRTEKVAEVSVSELVVQDHAE